MKICIIHGTSQSIFVVCEFWNFFSFSVFSAENIDLSDRLQMLWFLFREVIIIQKMDIVRACHHSSWLSVNINMRWPILGYLVEWYFVQRRTKRMNVWYDIVALDLINALLIRSIYLLFAELPLTVLALVWLSRPHPFFFLYSGNLWELKSWCSMLSSVYVCIKNFSLLFTTMFYAACIIGIVLYC